MIEILWNGIVHHRRLLNDSLINEIRTQIVEDKKRKGYSLWSMRPAERGKITVF